MDTSTHEHVNDCVVARVHSLGVSLIYKTNITLVSVSMETAIIRFIEGQKSLIQITGDGFNGEVDELYYDEYAALMLSRLKLFTIFTFFRLN